MANLTETPTWETGIYQLEEEDLVQGGPDGIDNTQAKQLANRTKYLKQLIEAAVGDMAAHLAAADPHTQYATEVWVAAQITALINAAPGALDTLDELAAALGDDANFAATIANALALKAALGVPQAFTKGQRGAETPLPATTGVVTLNLENSNNWGDTLTGDITLANPSTMPVGQSGVIRIVNGATPRTIAYGSYFKGALGLLPALTAVAGATDLLVYYVESASRVLVSAVGDTK